jgi:AcrR family transcriptional regulator
MSAKVTKTTDRPRRYRKRARAEAEAVTRRRITEAAVKLHGTVGPARTTVKGVAEEAGVQRATVYRHFPDEEALFAACSAHWASLNPPPNFELWREVDDPGERLRTALAEVYAWYEWAEPMLTNVVRDAPLVPAIQAPAAARHAVMAAYADVLIAGRRERGRRRERVAAAIGHALEFTTWCSLVREQGLDPDEAVEMMVSLVAAA